MIIVLVRVGMGATKVLFHTSRCALKPKVGGSSSSSSLDLFLPTLDQDCVVNIMIIRERERESCVFGSLVGVCSYFSFID